jgi:hypothetical protein
MRYEHHSSVSSILFQLCEICRKWHNDAENTTRHRDCGEEQLLDELWQIEEALALSVCVQPGRSPAGHVDIHTWCDNDICAKC